MAKPSEMIKRLEDKFEYLQEQMDELKRDLLGSDTPPESSPWEDGTIYKMVREWVVANLNTRALAVTQGKHGMVEIFFCYIMDECMWTTYYKELGTFPEHPRGWRNSFTPLPPLPRVEDWPEGAESFVIDAHVQYMPPELNTYHIYHKMYPRGLMDIWNFTRDELEVD